MPIYRLNTKIRLTMLCLSGFELYSRWVPPERLQENLTMRQPATKRIVLAFLIYFMSKLISGTKEIVPKRDL